MTRTRPTIGQLERHGPETALREFALAAQELLVAETIATLLERMPVATRTVIHEMSALLRQPAPKRSQTDD